MIRVVVVDDHELVRYALRTSIESEDDMCVVGEATCGEDALVLLETSEPAVVLLDLHMPGMGGLDACRKMLDAWPQLRVIILTSYDEDEEIFGALSAGAVGYLMKDTSPTALIESIRNVSEGQTVLDSAIARRVIRGTPDAETDDPGLSEREMDVLAIMARGASNREIARSLWISEPTVKTHVSHILRKLGQGDRTHAVVDAMRRGLVRPPTRTE
ncbi:MAG: DNA-binding response regulator [Actinobacteria bacterium HGW-Actinobacteria-6]|jgi:DNA-binding NarL/FixJ family response regulator|nr:MAG: DNA-binding response regulator [Actinobacteria bacterium HGW-Actinobacteria-6]